MQAKNSVMYNHKNLGNKSQELNNLKFSGRLFVSESMSHENQQLAYKYWQLKSAGRFTLPGSLTMLWTLSWQSMEEYTKYFM